MTVNHRRALIIGGGVAGPVLALFLKRSGFDVQILKGEYAELDTKPKMCNNVFQTSGALLWPAQSSLIR